MANWIDISRRVYPGMPVWPGDPPVEQQPIWRIDSGHAANVTRYILGSHTGTHVDPPLHFLRDGLSADALSLDDLCGYCTVVHAQGPNHVSVEDLLPAEGAQRILIRTRNSDADPGVFHKDFAGLSPEAALWLTERGVRLVGVDGPSVEPFGSSLEFPIHHMLLGAGIVLVETLDLSAVHPGQYEVVCAPIPWRGGDGAPARVLLRSVS